jgi:hypothetical protein
VIGLLEVWVGHGLIGAAAGGYIKAFLFNVGVFSPIVGGAILLWADQLDLKPHQHDAMTSRCRCTLAAIGFCAVPRHDSVSFRAPASSR